MQIFFIFKVSSEKLCNAEAVKVIGAKNPLYQEISSSGFCQGPFPVSLPRPKD